MRTALTVAGSDSAGGAGLQADVKAMSSLGVHAATVVTAVTAQNTRRVSEIFPVPPDMVQAQLDAVLGDCDIKAAKTGMLYSREIVGVVADALQDREAPLVVDPVMGATVGGSLCKGDFVRALKEKLLPICELVTPNRAEAEALAGIEIRSENDAVYACEIIGKQGSSVLLKGGHIDSKNVVDYLYLSAEVVRIRNPRLAEAGHGSGCALSSFITANLANGLDLTTAVLGSRKMIQRSIARQYAVGGGVPVVNTQGKLSNADDEKVSVIRELDEAVAKIVRIMPADLVPPQGMNIAYATKDAKGPGDIAAVDGRMTLEGGVLRKNGNARFGAAEHMSFILGEVMRVNPSMRCMMDIALTKQTLDAASDEGMRIVYADWNGGASIAESTRAAIDSAKKFPDIIADADGESRVLNVLGKSPDDVIRRLKRIL